MSIWVKFLGNKYALTELCDNEASINAPAFYESCINFCNAWLKGTEHFELQTSGTTGTPKSITVTRGQLKTSAQLTIEALQLKENDTALICLDTRYIAGIMMLVRSMEAGMNMCWMEPVSNPLKDISDEIDFVALVPLQIEAILKSPQREKLNYIKTAIVGGAALSKQHINMLSQMKCAVYATYGMTETLSHIALQKINGNDSQAYFKTLNTVSVSMDERGCLVIDAPHISESKIITNDLVQLISPSRFYWLGRWDNIINTGGVKVIPEKIETVIDSLFQKDKINNRFFVAALPDVRLGYTVNLFIEGKPLENSIEKKLIEEIESLISRYEKPKSIYYIKQFSETETGKINKRHTLSLLQNDLPSLFQ